jgi:hypothetical protein
MAHASPATVIVLQSHPAWLAAQERARERSESMRHHPSSFLTRKLAAAEGSEEVGPEKPMERVVGGHRRDE